MMKEPDGRTWVKSFGFTLLASLVFGYFIGTPWSWREGWKTLEYSAALATVVWLFNLARWNRAIIKS